MQPTDWRPEEQAENPALGQPDIETIILLREKGIELLCFGCGFSEGNCECFGEANYLPLEEFFQAEAKRKAKHRPSCLPKHDANKSRYDLIPPDALDAIAQVLTEGAAKYSPRGWESGTSWGRYFAACMRHLWAWWRGERLDPESALPHLAHAACCVMFLLAYEIREVGEDDRAGGG